MLPEVYAEFAGSKLAVQRISYVPISEQQEILDKKAVPCVIPPVGDDKTFDVRMLNPEILTQDQIHQVFAPDHVRSKVEQIAYLEDKRTAQYIDKGKKDQKRIGNLFCDRVTKTAKVLSGKVVAAEDVIEAAKFLS